MKIRHNHKNAIKSACGKKSVQGGATSRDNVKPLSVGQARVFTYQGDPCVFIGVPEGMIFRWYPDSYGAKSELNYVKNVIKKFPDDWEENLREYGFDTYDENAEYQTWSAKNPVKSSCGKKSVKASYGGWGKFYGLNDVEFTVPNDTDDPTIFYNGKYYNYYAIEDTLWDYYKEECAENGVKPDENDFENWVAENSYLVYDLLDEISPKSEPGRGVYREEANTLRRSIKSSTITAAADISGAKIIIRDPAFVDITEDDYEHGASTQITNSWDFDVRGEYDTLQELVDAIANNSYVFSNNIADYYYLDGRLGTSATVDVDNDIPSDSQIEAWKRGEETLYIADLYLALEVGGGSHEMTEDEAEAFGLSIY